MTSTVGTPPARPTHTSLRVQHGNASRRRRSDVAARIVLSALMGIASIPLILILFVVIREGAAVIDWGFLTSVEFPPARVGGGYAAGFVGTGIIVALAASFAIPTGMLAAVYLNEYGRGPLAASIRFFTDVMTGIPSVFVGLAIFFLLIKNSGGTITFGAFPAAVALGVIMLPIVVRTSEEILRTVPDELRQGSLAMGARQWQTTVKVVLPAAAPGLSTGAMLSVARAAGETAPLILTAFGSRQIVTALFNQPISAVPLQVYEGARQPFAPGIERAWGGALCLLVLVLSLTVLARWIGAKFTKVGGR